MVTSTMDRVNTFNDPELELMAIVVDAFSLMDDEAVYRILGYLNDRYESQSTCADPIENSAK